MNAIYPPISSNAVDSKGRHSKLCPSPRSIIIVFESNLSELWILFIIYHACFTISKHLLSIIFKLYKINGSKISTGTILEIINDEFASIFTISICKILLFDIYIIFCITIISNNCMKKCLFKIYIYINHNMI